MSLLSRIFGQTLSPAWEFTPGDVIWKLQVTGGGILVGESRDVDNKQLTLFGVRLSDGASLFRGVKLHEPWWIALEQTIGEVAILHLFPRPDLPNALGATAIDCATGEVLWSNESIRVLCGVREIALAQYGSTLGGNDLLLIDARTGAVLEELGDNVERAAEFQVACEDTERWDGWIGSEALTDEHPRHAELMEIVARAVPEQRGPVEIAEVGRYTVLSVHGRSRRSAQAMLGNLLDNILLVLDGDRTVYRETIVKDASGPSDDAFFIRNGQLIFIRDRSTLVSLNLDF